MERLTSGLYFLYQDKELVYIGKSKNLFSRIGTHINDNRKKFNSWTYYLCDDPEMSELELFLIAIHKPIYNKMDVSNAKIESYMNNDIDTQTKNDIEAYEMFYRYVDAEWLKYIFNTNDKTIERFIKRHLPEDKIKHFYKNGIDYIQFNRQYFIDNYSQVKEKIKNMENDIWGRKFMTGWWYGTKENV